MITQRFAESAVSASISRRAVSAVSWAKTPPWPEDMRQTVSAGQFGGRVAGRNRAQVRGRGSLRTGRVACPAAHDLGFGLGEVDHRVHSGVAGPAWPEGNDYGRPPGRS